MLRGPIKESVSMLFDMLGHDESGISEAAVIAFKNLACYGLSLVSIH
jgi:hypothetical protein